MASGTSIQGDFFFGWDLLYRTIQNEVNKKPDVLIALAHFMLVKHSNFRCLGVGEDKTLTENEEGSELLPDGWNNEENKYALRYVFDNHVYLLLGHLTEDTLIINLLNVDTKKVSNIGLAPDDVVKAVKGRITDLLPNASLLVDRFRRELVEPVFAGTTREVRTQTANARTGNDPLRIGRPMGQFVQTVEQRPFGFPDVGRGDLDPLGRIGQGGNLFPFPSQPGFQGRGQPRFDPFGPDDLNVPPNPNPDHLPRPGFGGHDFFM